MFDPQSSKKNTRRICAPRNGNACGEDAEVQEQRPEQQHASTTSEQRSKPLYMTFHYTGWFIGIIIIFIMAYYNPYITGSFLSLIYSVHNQGEFWSLLKWHLSIWRSTVWAPTFITPLENMRGGQRIVINRRIQQWRGGGRIICIIVVRFKDILLTKWIYHSISLNPTWKRSNLKT